MRSPFDGNKCQLFVVKSEYFYESLKYSSFNILTDFVIFKVFSFLLIFFYVSPILCIKILLVNIIIQLVPIFFKLTFIEAFGVGIMKPGTLPKSRSKRARKKKTLIYINSDSEGSIILPSSASMSTISLDTTSETETDNRMKRKLVPIIKQPKIVLTNIISSTLLSQEQRELLLGKVCKNEEEKTLRDNSSGRTQDKSSLVNHWAGQSLKSKSRTTKKSRNVRSKQPSKSDTNHNQRKFEMKSEPLMNFQNTSENAHPLKALRGRPKKSASQPLLSTESKKTVKKPHSRTKKASTGSLKSNQCFNLSRELEKKNEIKMEIVSGSDNGSFVLSPMKFKKPGSNDRKISTGSKRPHAFDMFLNKDCCSHDKESAETHKEYTDNRTSKKSIRKRHPLHKHPLSSFANLKTKKSIRSDEVAMQYDERAHFKSIPNTGDKTTASTKLRQSYENFDTNVDYRGKDFVNLSALSYETIAREAIAQSFDSSENESLNGKHHTLDSIVEAIDNGKFAIAIRGWGSKFGTIKCRTTDISEFQNCEY